MNPLERLLRDEAIEQLKNWRCALRALEASQLKIELGDLSASIQVLCADPDAFEELKVGMIRHGMICAFKRALRRYIYLDVVRVGDLTTQERSWRRISSY